jgi:FkbM family methyltransferase
MAQTTFKRVKVIHPLWNGHIRLLEADHLAIHEGPGAKGRYELSGKKLVIFWEQYKPETFYELSGTYVHEQLFDTIPMIEKIFSVSLSDTPLLVTRLSVVVPGTDVEVSLRLHSSDIQTFTQIFLKRDYESANLPGSANAIVDLGANIGLATVFFALKYPEAQILSVEPDEGNFLALTSNVAVFGNRIQTQHAAVWTKDGFVDLSIEDETGSLRESWAIKISDSGDGPQKTKCWTLETALNKAAFGNIDILKIDIEGAEFEIFSIGAERWLPRISLMIIETHDRFRPGSEATVRKALYPMFEELPAAGENLFFRRRGTSP